MTPDNHSPGAGSGLGRLATVPPREVWRHEALEFTPWMLANVDVLADLLGMDLSLQAAEHPVGGFSLDLIGTDESTGETVIIENQLEISDHTHLGQIITYAAGTDPTTIVWVTTGFRPEHRAAIDWLNSRTDEHTRVFGVVIHVVRIGDSEPAPNFELVVQPNDWEKEVKRAASSSSGVASAKAAVFREFWEATLSKIHELHPTWTRARTSGGPWVNTPTGVASANYSMSWVGGRLICQVYFESPDADLNTARFAALHERRSQFEAALGCSARWDPMTSRKGARIIVDSPHTDISQTDAWPDMIDWLVQTQTRLRAAVAAAGGIPAT